MEGCIAEQSDEVADISINLEQCDGAPVLKVADNELPGIDVVGALPVKMAAENVAPIVVKTDAPNQQPVCTGI